MATLTIAVFEPLHVRPPRFALLPAATPPRGGLLLSVMVHAVMVLAALTWLPVLFPGRPFIVAHTTADILRDPDQEVHLLPAFPRITDVGSRGDLIRELRKMERSLAKARSRAGRSTSNPPKPNYAAPQVIVSNLPSSTNDVQTILRPDLPAPPKLKYPVRLQSMMMLPAPSAPTRVVPQLEQPVVSNPVGLVPFQATVPRAQIPVLPIGAPKPSSAVPAEQAVPKIMGTSEHSLPVFPATIAPELVVPKAVVALNAVTAPPEAVPIIPDSELDGRFVVGPSRDAGAVETTSAIPGAEIVGANSSNPGGSSSHSIVENEAGKGVEAGGWNAGVGRSGSPSGWGTQPASGGETVAAAGSRGVPGISVSGGIPGRGGQALATSSIPRRSYALTIISGGSSGGASRDLGVFSRSETVYTVYIPMSDAGGGPDWPMQYALMSSAPAGNGLLTPPVVLKKIPATRPKTDLTSNSGPVFVTGIVDEKGKLKGLRPIYALNVRAQSAIDALAKWEFLPAQLEGKPVATKVLIGVSLVPDDEVGKQN